MVINFKDSDETCSMRTKSDNTEIKMGDEIDEIIEEFFGSLLHVFYIVDLLYYYLPKISLNKVRSQIYSPEQLKKINNKF